MLAFDISPFQNKKNLLAFSAGIDSSALFFLLIEKGIKFDIAIVNYGIREQSKAELRHAKALARKYKLFCHHINAPIFKNNFEAQARDFRYEFFTSLIQIEGYDTLITAHQLDDQLEWLLMRLVRGAGLSELLGLKVLTQKKDYQLIRPLLSHSKEALFDYLHKHKYPYFVDESNKDRQYERNQFRQDFSEALIAKYAKGIARSFDYLQRDKIDLESRFQTIYTEKDLHIIQLDAEKDKTKASDLVLKGLGYLLSASQRQEITRENSLVIGGKWAIEIQKNRLYIAPYIDIIMPKEFKEHCRTAEIPRKIRPYLCQENISFKFMQV
jgi:tRNA(Ile)-lysidine synthase